ncbi:class I adenylate-forming enzyme family protein [Halomarina halobia]|uniref:Class I adenylate-forming enzyme family protein n=1 Tax=Halomarina halobia TaxID=3033386 RepID=A0ABD6ADR5_9EURY|nr:AMP-binding protein [Halomarina sp. PSR21]
MGHPTVRELLAQCAASVPEATALRDPSVDASLTYAEWDELTTRVANGLLDAGVGPDDHLSIMTKDSVEMMTLLFAALEINVTVNPVSYRAPAGRLSYVLDHAASDALAFDAASGETVRSLAPDELPPITIAVEGGVEGVDHTFDDLTDSSPESPHVPLTEDDPALLLYTSGTTGKPKGVRHTHRNVVEADLLCLPFNRLRPSDTNVALGPLYHVGPLLANFMPALHVGATNVIQRDFDPAVTLDYIEREGVTSMWGVPTHFNAILNEGSIDERDTDGVRMIQYSGSAMPPEVVRRCREHFPGVDFVNAYGTTEIIFATVIYPEEHDDHLGSIGRAVPNAEVRLVDPDDPVPRKSVPRGEVGEILVKTPTCMEGYWRAPEKTERATVDGWYRTGDLGRRDEAGFVYFVDRKDSMIVSGGENIYPAEVENVLHEHDGVDSVAVVGAPDEEWGEVVTAFVVRSTPDVTREDLERHVLESDDIEDFKRPRRYVFRSELPKTESGKIARQTLVEEVTAG